jgi:predicted dehydrogenase
VKPVTVGLLGAGYWGSKLARNIFEVPACRLAAVCDESAEHREAVARRYPDVDSLATLGELLERPDIDAVVVATPAVLHAEHVSAALDAGKHVLVEKPLALSSAEAAQLAQQAQALGLTLMVGHTFLYSEPVRVLRRLVEAGELGQVLYVYGQRVNLGVIREDLNALWNFGPHDISILIYLLDAMPISVSARQFSLLNRKLQDVAFLVLEFPGGVIGHIQESWLDPRKLRQFTVVGDRKMATYDDTDPESPLRIYDKGVMRLDALAATKPYGVFKPEQPEGYGEFKLEVRAGDLLVPRIETREPLRVEIEHFADCIRDRKPPLTDAVHGAQVVAVLEAAERSSAADGRAVPLDLRSATIRAVR